MNKGRLLIIDDELGPRESLRFLFKDAYDVVCVESVDAGIREIRNQPPDCIVTDIKMPRKDGIAGLKEIRQLDADVSVIMLTGFGSLETAQEAIRYGASDYVKKPFDAEEMRRTVQAHVERTRIQRARHAAVDDLRKLNEQLQTEISDKEHLAQLGQASSEFVHDIRNPLTVICGYVSLLMDNIKNGPSPDVSDADQETSRDYLEKMEKSVLRCQEMAQMWRSLAQPNGGEDQFRDCTAADILTELRDALLPLARKSDADIELEIRDRGLVVRGDNLQIYRAMQNVAGNALQALPTFGGILRIRLSRADADALIEVSDNGCGIPSDKLEAVFSPYVSTRKKQGGMGIGLFITRKIIEQHGGAISLANRPEGGVTATIRLPLKTS